VKLEVSPGQRFTCQQCGMCCRGAWVVVTPAEVDRYRATGVARFYSDDGAPDADPFEPVAHGHFRIRKRADGACGFLSPDDRCRIHEELGGAAKPLACRVFPFRFPTAPGRPLVATSASCPTIVKNEGEPLAAQLQSLAALRAEWTRAFPSPERTLLFARGRPVEAATVAAIKAALAGILDRGGAESIDGVAGALERMARWLEDLSRHRVARLPPDAFGEYVTLTGRHAAVAAGEVPLARPSAVTRLLARGFLFTVVAVRDQLASEAGGPRRHLRRLRQLAHLHGLAPATETLDRAARDTVTLDGADLRVPRILAQRLRAMVDALGSGQRPLVDEIAVECATLAAGLDLAAMAARRAGAPRIDAAALTTGITAAAQLAHADTGALGSLLPALAGGPDALRLVSARLARSTTSDRRA
jgi:Fe-S-cluster containining protein